ncbi:MAG TPA: response regulator [Ignavibacteria bacterium]|jgi:DNA-binding response OmpR family regulator
MSAKIVLVEDEKIISLLLTKMLEKRGYSVLESFDQGEDVIDYVKGKKVDVALLDIYLKGKVNGIEAAKQINSFSDTVIIFLTANTDRATKEMALETRQAGYFEKPLSDAELDEICEIIETEMSKKPPE